MPTQKESNPFPNSDSNKRYYTYEYYLRRRYGKKVAKIPLDAGFSCPNIDRGGGCVYCSARGSGDCVPEGLSLREQYDAGRAALSRKWDVSTCIGYLQAHTNTYAPIERLRQVYDEVLDFPGIVGMNVATRADCLPPQVCDLLREVSQRTDLCVELGLQSSSDRTADRIRRGHTYAQFVEGFERLRTAVPLCSVCVHVIFGLPGEDDDDMLRTVTDLARLRPDQVKLHLLHVLRGTPLGDDYLRGEYTPLSRERYVDLVCRALTLLPPDTAIARLTGDGLAADLLAPDWSRKKTCVINEIDKTLYTNNLYQGIFYTGETK